MLVETKIVGRRAPFERRAFELRDGPHTLRSLLTRLVEVEVRRYQDTSSATGRSGASRQAKTAPCSR